MTGYGMSVVAKADHAVSERYFRFGATRTSISKKGPTLQGRICLLVAEPDPRRLQSDLRGTNLDFRLGN